MATRKPGNTSRSTSRTETSKKDAARTSKNVDSGGAASKTSARSTVSGPSQADLAGQRAAGDAHVAKMAATQALAAQMPFNANKEAEHGAGTPLHDSRTTDDRLFESRRID